jgi:hypothetical protein
MSGLTVGYLSIDELILELKIKNGTPEEKVQVIAPGRIDRRRRY